MVAKVYIWMPKVGGTVSGSVVSTAVLGFFTREATSYGHAALQIPGRAYMSYWPSDQAGKVSDANLSYEQDKDDCYGEADHTINIYNLDETALLAYWQEEKKKPFDRWRRNCCTITSMAIHSGFNSKASSDLGFYVKACAKALLHPFQSYDVFTEEWMRFLITHNEPESLLKLAKYYKILSD